MWKLPADVDVIAGNPRSGLFVASIISLYRNIPLTDIDGLVENKLFQSGVTKERKSWVKSPYDAKRILIVEDSSISGKSLSEIKRKLKLLPAEIQSKCTILTIYVTKETQYMTDIFFEICPPPRVFEWNYLHHSTLSRTCFDIDGVICEDPSEEENDDGERYISFLENAKVKLLPTVPVEAFVTSRLEKYRPQTELWLKKNNVRYHQLYMMDLPSKEARVQLGSHAKYKAEIYKKMNNCNLFVESNYAQAVEIAKLSKKAVFCTENSCFIEEGSIERVNEYVHNSIASIKAIIKKVLPESVVSILKSLCKKFKQTF